MKGLIWLMWPAIIFTLPKAYVRENTHDFGKIAEGPRYFHTFFIKNTGKDTLKILKVMSSCGCTAALLSSKNIAPGDSAKLEVAFDSRGYAGVKILKHVYVLTNDPKNPKITFTITGEVYKGPTAKGHIEPITLNIGTIKAGESVEETIKIISEGKAPLIIEYAKGTPYITILPFQKDTLKPGDTLKVRVKVSPQNTGEYEGVVFFRTNDPEIAYKIVRLTGKVK